MSAAADRASVSSVFDIFAHGPIHTSETAYIPIAPYEQNNLKFFIPANNDTYIDLDIKLYVRGKLISASGKDVDFTDLTGVTNNFLDSVQSM